MCTNIAAVGRTRPQLGNDIAVAALGHEADILAFCLVGNRQPHLGRDLTGFRLRPVTKWKPQKVDFAPAWWQRGSSSGPCRHRSAG